MDWIYSRPENIVGNVALASLVGGLPMGLLLSIVAALVQRDPSWSVATFLREVINSATFAGAIVFIVGMLTIAPALALLRRFGFGGPFFVYGISVAVALPFFANGLTPGIAVMALGGAASHAFCRVAYVD